MSISVVPDPLAPRADVTGSAPRLVWPKELVRPEVPPALVWFDLNHWIGLAKAAVGHPDGARYADLLDAARLADGRGAAIFVLNDTHYMELAAISDPRQRKDIAVVMGQLTGFRSLAVPARRHGPGDQVGGRLDVGHRGPTAPARAAPGRRHRPHPRPVRDLAAAGR